MGDAHELVSRAIASLIENARAATLRVRASEPDDEAVHDFRVALRRLRSVLRATRSIYGKKRLERFEIELKRIADTTGALRDAEVLSATLESIPLASGARGDLVQWLAGRGTLERRLRRRALEALRGHGQDQCLSGIEAVLASGPKRKLSPQKFARRALRSGQEGVQETLGASIEDAAALHRLRIRFKRLRYVCEMLGGFLTAEQSAAALREPRGEGEPLSTRTIPNYAAIARVASELQTLLGEVHDLDEAAATMRRVRRMRAANRVLVLAALAHRRGQLIDRFVALRKELPERLPPV